MSRLIELKLLSASLVLLVSTATQAQDLELDYATALQLARERAPSLSEARSNLHVTQARVDTADTWRKNPRIALEAGPRFGDQTDVDFGVGIFQPITIGGKPKARKDVASAENALAEKHIAEIERVVVSETAAAFSRALFCKAQVALAQKNLKIATDIVRMATQREQAGDVGAIDTAIATLAKSRAEADLARVHVDAVTSEFELRTLLGFDDSQTFTVTGDLDDVAKTIDDSKPRTDLAVAFAKIEVATAKENLAKKDALPEFGIGVNAALEERTTIITGVFEFTLPFFYRGQTDRMTAASERVAHEEHAEIISAQAQLQQSGVEKKIKILETAATSFRETGLIAARRTEEISNKSYELGALSLPDLLMVRRELISAEKEYLRLTLQAALARVERQLAAGNISTSNQQKENQ